METSKPSRFSLRRFVFPFVLEGFLYFNGYVGDDGAARTKEHKWIRRVLPDD